MEPSWIYQAVSEAGAAQRLRASARPYSFYTEPGYVLPWPSRFAPTEAFELTRRERQGLFCENGPGWARANDWHRRLDRAACGTDDSGWGS